MGLVTYEAEITRSIPPAKVVEVLVQANHLPKVVLQRVIKMTEVIRMTEVIKETTSSKGIRYKTVKHTVEAPDKDNVIYRSSIDEGDKLANTFERIHHVVKITASPEGGSVCKNTSKYIGDDVDIGKEKIKANKEKAAAMFEAIDAYLVANPHE